MPAEIRVKFLTKNPALDIRAGWNGFLPSGDSLVGRCRFLFNREERVYDWLVVYDDLPPVPVGKFKHWIEPLACPRENTLLITTEPSSIKIYGRGFLRQFGHVLTSQEPWAIQHPGAIYRQAGLIRFYEGEHDHILQNPPLNKTASFSTVCSSKRQRHTLHNARFQFTQRLKAALPELEIFGHGVRPIARKNDALDSYRYHLAIENHIAPHHWTEKLADAFIGHCLCFYHGAPNAADYFPPDSFIPINIHHFEESLARIQSAITNNEYEKRLPAIREARRLALTRWSTFPQLAEIIQSIPATAAAPGSAPSAIFSRHGWRASHPAHALGYVCEKLAARLRLALSH
jgi:hypothetical protein